MSLCNFLHDRKWESNLHGCISSPSRSHFVAGRDLIYEPTSDGWSISKHPCLHQLRLSDTQTIVLQFGLLAFGNCGCWYSGVHMMFGALASSPEIPGDWIGSVFFAPAEVSKTNPAWHVFTLSFVPIQYPKLFRKNVVFVHGKHGSCAKAKSPWEKLWQMLLESHLRQRMWNVQVAI